MEDKPILSVKDLRIAFQSIDGFNSVVHNIAFDVFENEIIGIVGESGSGKSVTALSLMQLLPKGQKTQISGTITYQGRDLNSITKTDMQDLRGREISMVFQEPMSALNPSMRCGDQVKEIILHHGIARKEAAAAEVLHLLESVKMPSPAKAMRKYPHELSGGQQQRIMIAMAIACKPKVLIADEPTTALDVTVQKEIISLLKRLQKETKMSVIFISHDLTLVSEIAQRTLVMYQGKIVEKGATKTIFKTPKNDYTKALIAARPEIGQRLHKLPTINDVLSDSKNSGVVSKKEREKAHKILYSAPPILEVINLGKVYYKNIGLFGQKAVFKAVDGVSFKLYEGETLGLVGESGCGKSSLGKAILQLDKATSGSIIYKGKDLSMLSKKELRQLRKEVQIIFQDPLSSLNPRLTVGMAIMEPMGVHKLHKNDTARKLKTLELLEKVGLNHSAFERYPHEFSGGQRQRIGIARTIAVEPKLILCDESVSALDISVQAQVLNLLNALKKDFGFTYIFISHDLAVVKYMSDQLIVMDKGKIVEKGEADYVYANPKKPYTKKLIGAIPKGL